jgi:hypothetical protein
MTYEDPGMRGEQAPPPVEKQEPAVPEPKSENDRLHQRIQQLEQEQERARQTIAALQAERDAYRRAAYAWALEQITDEEVERYGQTEEGLALDDFIGELEHPERTRRDA